MRKDAAKTPFRWSRAIACVVGCAAGACAVLALLTGLHPDVTLGDYIIAIGFGAIVGSLVYAGRNKDHAAGLDDDGIGSMADYSAGIPKSTLGLMGLDKQLSRESTEASRRLHD